LVTNYFSALLAKKEELSIQPDSTKKRPLLNNNKDQFFAVSGKPSGKPAIDGFFKDLTISKPAQVLPKKIPLYNKKEEVFQALYDYSVAYFKAAWYIKLIAAYSASQSDSKVCPSFLSYID
jgi:Transcription mediator complex subunit Med12